MKKIFFLIFTIVVAGSLAMSANAQMMGARLPDGQGFSNSSADWDKVVEHTLREEKEGKELWDKFQAKEVACANLNDEQFGVLGEYFMGTMMGNSHASMNAMMIQMHGEEGEEQIHIVMGKRLSGCDTSAVASGISGGWMPMMSMMTPLRQGFGGQAGGWSFDGAQGRSSPFGFNNQSNNSMMNFGFMPFGGFGWIFMILWWVLIIAGIIALVRWIAGQPRGGTHGNGKSAFDILKDRYARGEIDKKELEEKKKDLE